jgi:hypothetical protein
LLERVNEFQNYEFPASPVSSPAGRLNTSARTSIRRKMVEILSILAATNVAKIILVTGE